VILVPRLLYPLLHYVVVTLLTFDLASTAPENPRL